MNDYLRTVIVAPMTTSSRPAPYRIEVTFNGKKGLILLDQIRTLDKQRLIKKAGAIFRKMPGVSSGRAAGNFRGSNSPYRIVYVRFIGTHAEYDKVDVQRI